MGRGAPTRIHRVPTLLGGGVNRSGIIEAFDVSVPQVSKDLTLYQKRAPMNAVYDTPPVARRPQDQQIVVLREGGTDENHR